MRIDLGQPRGSGQVRWLDGQGGIRHARCVRELLECLDDLRKRDPAFRVFGARTHRYRLEPANSHAVERFEEIHGVVLPEAYRRFLLGVTDGGAGPGYGLFGLLRQESDEVSEDLALLDQPFDYEKFLALKPPDPLLREQDEDASERAYLVYYQDMPGTMTLCHYGCAIRAYLVVTGELAGYVITDRRSEDAGVALFTHAADGRLHGWDRRLRADRHPLDFVAWYRDWLEASLEACN